MALTVAQHLGDSAEVRTQLEKLGLKPVKIEIVKAEYACPGAVPRRQRYSPAPSRRHSADSAPQWLQRRLWGRSGAGIPKQLKVTFRLDGKQSEATFLENDLILLNAK